MVENAQNGKEEQWNKNTYNTYSFNINFDGERMKNEDFSESSDENERRGATKKKKDIYKQSRNHPTHQKTQTSSRMKTQGNEGKTIVCL